MTDTAGEPSPTARRVELAANLADFRALVAGIAHAAGRDPAGITLVAVTKTFPASDVRLLAELGVGDVGENRDQEASGKFAQCPGSSLRWHFVGRLQRNKCRSVATYADVVHSLDRPALVDALSAAAVAAGRTVQALVQVSLDPHSTGQDGGEPDGRGGAAPDAVMELADRVAAAPGLSFGGVMAVAPLEEDPGSAFARLAAIAHQVRQVHPDAGVVSAGMSGDFAAAIRHGATHLRIGTALLGHRGTPVG